MFRGYMRILNVSCWQWIITEIMNHNVSGGTCVFSILVVDNE